MPYLTSLTIELVSGDENARYIPVPSPLESATILAARAAYDGSVTSAATLTFATGPSTTDTGVITVPNTTAAGSIIDYVETTSSNAHKTIATAASHALRIKPSDHGAASVNVVVTILWDEFVRT